MSTSVSPCAEAAVAAEETLDGGEMVAVECDLVGRCRLIVSKPVLKAPMVSAFETIIS
jgi:hypothetical protein